MGTHNPQNLTTKQAKCKRGVKPGTINNPTGIGGFRVHPENRSDGRWNKDNSFLYWLNFFKSLSVEEFKKYGVDKPQNERTVACSLAYERIKRALLDLKEFQEVANRTEGTPISRSLIENNNEKPTNQYNILIVNQDPKEMSEAFYKFLESKK